MSFSRVRVVLLSGVFMLPAATTWAQSTTPAARATTQPIPADSSTPRGALKALVGAMQAGDVPKIKSLIATTNPTEEKMVDAMAMMAVSQKKFRNAALAAYGPSELTGDTEAGTAAGLAKIDAAPEVITGDTATVDPSGVPGTAPLALERMNGSWRVPLKELARGVDQNAIQQRLDDLTFVSKMMDESADEVARGMYKTPKDADEAIKSKMMVAMMKHANAATQATTQSAPPPDAPAPAPNPPAPGM